MILLLATFISSIGLAAACSVSGVHITVGSVFEGLEYVKDQNQNSIIYVVGFMSTGPCDESSLKLKIWLKGFEDREVAVSKRRSYRAPEDSGVKYEREFYFFKIPLSAVAGSMCAFSYQIRHKELESPVFDFESQLFCSNYYKVLSFGQHDASKIGSRLIDAAKYQSFDLLVLTGNYVTGYHLDNGLLGDAYFARMEVLTTRMLTLAIPGRREAFDNYRMFNSRFLMPGCNEEVDCEVVHISDRKVDLLLINLDQVLAAGVSDLSRERRLMSKIRVAFKRIHERGTSTWTFAFTNADFYCSMASGHRNCLVDIYKLKMFEDLFDHLQVNLVVSSGRKLYEAVRDIHNFAIRTHGEPRNYVVSGIAGSTNYLAENKVDFMPDLSFSGQMHHQAVFTMDVFKSYYKMDLLDVPNFTSVDLRFIRMSFDWRKVLLYFLFFLGMLLIFALFEYNRPRNIGTSLAMERHGFERLGKKEQKPSEDNPVDVQLT